MSLPVDNVQNSNSAENQPNVDALVQGLSEEKNPELAVPEKFRGKSVADVAKAYVELESHLGKQGQELGELRRITDAYIKQQLERDLMQNSPANATSDNSNGMSDLDISDLGIDDEETARKVKKLLEKEISPVKSELVELKKERFLTKLGSKHSDFENIVKDKGFQDWVMESPVRIELYRRADKNFDFASADELFNIWKDKKGVPEKLESAVKEAEGRRDAFSAARMETGGSDTGEVASKPRYRRIDIQELMIKDPERYRALAPEILKAYAEKRVY